MQAHQPSPRLSTAKPTSPATATSRGSHAPSESDGDPARRRHRCLTSSIGATTLFDPLRSRLATEPRATSSNTKFGPDTRPAGGSHLDTHGPHAEPRTARARYAVPSARSTLTPVPLRGDQRVDRGTVEVVERTGPATAAHRQRKFSPPRQFSRRAHSSPFRQQLHFRTPDKCSRAEPQSQIVGRHPARAGQLVMSIP